MFFYGFWSTHFATESVISPPDDHTCLMDTASAYKQCLLTGHTSYEAHNRESLSSESKMAKCTSE